MDVRWSLVWHLQQTHAHCYRGPDLLLLAHLLAKQILPGQNSQCHIHGRRVCCREVSQLARFPRFGRTRHPLTAGENVVPYRYIDWNAAVPWQLEEAAFDPDEKHTGREREGESGQDAPHADAHPPDGDPQQRHAERCLAPEIANDHQRRKDVDGQAKGGNVGEGDAPLAVAQADDIGDEAASSRQGDPGSEENPVVPPEAPALAVFEVEPREQKEARNRNQQPGEDVEHGPVVGIRIAIHRRRRRHPQWLARRYFLVEEMIESERVRKSEGNASNKAGRGSA